MNIDQTKETEIHFRPLEESDVHKIHQWHNDEELYSTLLGVCNHPTLESVSTWLQNQIGPNSKSVAFAVCLKETHIGNLYFRDIDPILNQAEIHLFIGEKEYQNKGIGSSIFIKAFIYGWNILKLKRIYGIALAKNHRILHVLQNLGMKIEAKLPNHAVKNNIFHDAILIAINRG